MAEAAPAAMTPDEIMELYDELGWPSAPKFAKALRRRGLKVTDADVLRNIVGLQSERQVAAPPPKYYGRSSPWVWTRSGSPT